MSNVNTSIQPVIVVNGGGIPIIPGIGTPSKFLFSQDLSVGPLSATDAIASVKEALWLALAFTDGAGGGLSADQTLTVTYDSGDGAAYNTVIINETIPAGSKSKWFAFPGGSLFEAADHIKIQLTNTVPNVGNSVSGTLMYGV